MSISRTLSSNDIAMMTTVGASYEQSVGEQELCAPPSGVEPAPIEGAAPPATASDTGLIESEGGCVAVAIAEGSGDGGVEQVSVLELQLDASLTRYNLTRSLESDNSPPANPVSVMAPTPDPWQLMMYREVGIDPTQWTPFTGDDWNKEIIGRVYDWFTSVQYENSRMEWGAFGESLGECVIETLNYTQELFDVKCEAAAESVVVAIVSNPASEMVAAVIVEPSAEVATAEEQIVIIATNAGEDVSVAIATNVVADATTVEATADAAVAPLTPSLADSSADARPRVTEGQTFMVVIVPWTLREALEIPQESLRLTGFDATDIAMLQDALRIADGLLSLSVGNRYQFHLTKNYAQFEAGTRVREDFDRHYQETSAQSRRREAELRNLFAAREAESQRDERLNRLREYLKQIEATRALKHQRGNGSGKLRHRAVERS